MTAHIFGDIVGDEEAGSGLVNLARAILLREYSTVAIQNLTQGIPAIALRLAGEVRGNDDTFAGTFMMSALDAGALAGHLFNAVQRTDNAEAMTDFHVGFKQGNEAAS